MAGGHDKAGSELARAAASGAAKTWEAAVQVVGCGQRWSPGTWFGHLGDLDGTCTSETGSEAQHDWWPAILHYI